MNMNNSYLKFTIIMVYFNLSIFGQANNIEPYIDYKIDKNYSAVKISDDIILDGVINEKFWENTNIIKDLVQVAPQYNTVPSKQTDIKICYDDNFLYVAVMLYDDLDKISYKKGDYDDFFGTFDSNSDYFIFELDSFHDHKTSYAFAVNSSNVKSDYMIYNDEHIDDNWNAHWEASINNNEEGWSIEYRIPLEVLRFDQGTNLIWGINFIRYIKRNNEYIYWVVLPEEKIGLVSHYGHLLDINIKQQKSIIFQPYFLNGNTSYDDSFYHIIIDYDEPSIDIQNNESYKEQSLSNNIGFNIKYIINSNSTLDFSYKPDFGQINQDPSEVNNTAYETYYEERRDFFLENELFFKTPINVFYSRRMGGTERIHNSNELLSFTTELNSAAKYTFKNNNLNYGLILSYATPDHFRNLNTGNPEGTFDIHSSVFRISKSIASNKYNVGIIGTNYYTKYMNAKVYGYDFSLNFIENKLFLDGQLVYSENNSKNGRGYNFEIGYRSNLFKIFDKQGYYIDFWYKNNQYGKLFDINALGYLFRNNLKESNIGLSINNDNKINISKYILQYYQAKNFSNEILTNIISFNYNLMFKNLSYVDIGVSQEFEHYNDRYYDDYFSLDLGKTIKIPNTSTLILEYGSDIRKLFSYSLIIKDFINDIDDKGEEYIAEFKVKPNNWIELDFSYDMLSYYETYHFLKIRQPISSLPPQPVDSPISENNNLRNEDPYQYVFTNSNNLETYYTAQLSTYFNKVTLQFYLEYFIHEDTWKSQDEGGNEYTVDNDFINYNFPIINGGLPLINSEQDNLLYNALYSSAIMNLVLKWKFLQNSNLYFVYSLNKAVNGEKFNGIKDLINFQTEDIDPNTMSEIFYDSSIFIKCELYFNH